MQRKVPAQLGPVQPVAARLCFTSVVLDSYYTIRYGADTWIGDLATGNNVVAFPKPAYAGTREKTLFFNFIKSYRNPQE